MTTETNEPEIDITKVEELPRYFFIMVKVWLTEDGEKFFNGLWKEHGSVSPVLTEVVAGQIIPHPVHLREGMSVRNFLRGNVECETWDQNDLDNLWQEVVKRAVGIIKI